MYGSKKKIVWQEIYVSERWIWENRDMLEVIDKKIADCKQRAWDLAKEEGYKNPQLYQEAFLPDWPIYDGVRGYQIPNGWRECHGGFKYIVAIEDAEKI
jgi:hypothetical protein